MKKIVLLNLLTVIICFSLPIIFTKKYAPQEVSTKVEEGYDYKQYSTIKLLHDETGEIEELNLDEYLYGVVSAEMPANFELEALKAQAVVARTYTIYKIINGGKHDAADICDSASCCQAWISKEDRFTKWNERRLRNKLGKNCISCGNNTRSNDNI